MIQTDHRNSNNTTALSQVLKDLREMEEEESSAEPVAKRPKADVSSASCTPHDYQIFTNFMFNHLHSDDIAVNSKAQHNVKLAAFKIVEQKYCQAHNVPPFDKKSPLYFKDRDEDNTLCGEDNCYHHLIRDISRLAKVIVDLYNTRIYKLNYYIFIPYLKQLKQTLNLFVHDACCKKLVRSTMTSLNDSLRNANEHLAAIKRLTRSVQTMNVFLELPLYECGICSDVSSDDRFLKPDECCGYKICNLCYANLWKFSNSPHNPVCPVCKTSYRVEKQHPRDEIILTN